MYWDGGPVTFPSDNANFQTFVVGINVSSICSAKATHVSFSINYTTNTIMSSFNFSESYMRNVMAKMARKVGGLSFRGTLPITCAHDTFP